MVNEVWFFPRRVVNHQCFRCVNLKYLERDFTLQDKLCGRLIPPCHRAVEKALRADLHRTNTILTSRCIYFIPSEWNPISIRFLTVDRKIVTFLATNGMTTRATTGRVIVRSFGKAIVKTEENIPLVFTDPNFICKKHSAELTRDMSHFSAGTRREGGHQRKSLCLFSRDDEPPENRLAEPMDFHHPFSTPEG